VNNIIYEGIASRKSYILLTVAILLFSTISVKFGIISTYGQQPTVNDTAEQVNPSLESQDRGKLLAIPEPSANDLSTTEREQSGTINDGSKEKAAEIQEKQNNADETTRNSVDDNVDSNEDSGRSQPEVPEQDDDQSRNDKQDSESDDKQDSESDDKQDSESENEDENDVESEENDTPLDFEATTGLDDDEEEELPFP
jgi:hypothetical protein